MTQQLLSRNADVAAPELPAELGSTQSKLVYLYIRTAGASTVDDLQAALDMQKISLFPLLKTLSKKGLIERDGETYLPS